MREVRGEYSTTSFATFGKFATELPPKEIVVSRGQANVEEMLCIQESYRKSSADLDTIQHRLDASHVDSRNLHRRMLKIGKHEWEADMEYADRVLDEAGINPETLLSKGDGVLEKTIKKPEERSEEEKFASVEDIVSAFNQGKRPEFQIKNRGYIVNIEDCPKRAIIASFDGVLTAHQNEIRGVNGKKPYKSRVWVETYVVHIQIGDEMHVMTAENMFVAFKKFLAFALENGLRDGVPVVFFSDGAKEIRKTIETYFSFYPYRLFLDWYHLQKKIRQFISSVFKGSFDEKQKIHYEICARLWAGNVDDARTYIESLRPQVRNEGKFEEMMKYLENRDPNLYCYALRKELGLRNASSLVEQANNRLVAARQKNSNMSWNFDGSWALGAITARRENTGTKLNCRLTAQSNAA